MKPLSLALVISALFTSSALAERFGSETSILVQGTYYEAGETVSTELANHDVRSTTKQTVSRVSNRTILEAMRDRNLITSISGYRLVMVAYGHMADGVALFATKKSGAPVPVPSDLLSLEVSEGPATGRWVVDADAVLKSLRQQTINQASLTLPGGFTGTGLLNQAWTARSVKNGDTTEMVELVLSGGSFTGDLNSSPQIGVGTAQIMLVDAKIVDLTRYDMAPIDTGDLIFGSVSSSSATLTLGSSTGLSGTTTLTSGGFTYIYNSSTGILTASSANALTITDSTVNLSNTTFSGTLTINTTTGGTATGLVVDADGNVTQFPTFGSSLPGTLIIITSSGTHTYTHDSNGVWTLVTS